MWSKAFNLSTPQQKPKQVHHNLPQYPATAPKPTVSSSSDNKSSSEEDHPVPRGLFSEFERQRSGLSSVDTSDQPVNGGTESNVVVGETTLSSTNPNSSKTTTSRRKSGKILKKLLCAPKSAIKKTLAASSSSTSEVDGFGADSDSVASSSLYGVVISAPSSTADASEFSSQTTPYYQNILLEQTKSDESRTPKPEKENNPKMARSSSSSIRDLDEDYEQFMEQKEHRMDDKQSATTISKTIPVAETPSPRRKEIDGRLEATASPDHQNDIFLPHGSSSSDDDGSEVNRVDDEADMTTPQKSSTSSLPMKTPGIAIPTPSAKLVRESHDVAGVTGCGILPFPHRLPIVTESPTKNDVTSKTTVGAETTSPRNLQTNTHGDGDDDAAFLPDDFGRQVQPQSDDDAFLPDDFQQPHHQSYTWEDVQKYVHDAEQKLQDKLLQQHQTEMEGFQEAAEKILLEHGSSWKQESEAEYARLRALLREENMKTAKKDDQLVGMEQTLQKLQAEVEGFQKTKGDLETRINELEETNETRVLSLASSKELLEERVAEMEKASESAAMKDKDELSKMMAEKVAVEAQLADLKEKLEEQLNVNEKASSRLLEAEEEIVSVKKQTNDQLQAASDASMKELLSAQTEIENLRRLRTQDEQEREMMQSKLKLAAEEYGSTVTPRKSAGVPPSPGSEVDQGDIISKMEQQLEGMGKVLKRYKAERDDLKSELETREKRQVQAIEIAVKQATAEMSKQIQHLEEETERIRTESAEKTTKEIEELTREVEILKSEQDDKLAVLKETSSRELEQLQKDRDAELEEFKDRHAKDLEKILAENETAKSDHERSLSQKQEELEQQISKMLEMHNEEIELVRTESRQEIERLQAELQRKTDLNGDIESLKIQLDSAIKERDELSKETSKFETQLKDIKDRHTSSLREVRAEHGKEIDELLAQLDMVEAEQNEKASKLQELVKEKELCLSAVSTNLADAESRFVSSRNEAEKLAIEVDILKRDLDHAKTELISFQKEHDRAMDEQAVLRDKACEEVQQRIIKKVEKQFDERNAMYKELKRSFEESNSKVSILERDLRFAKKESDELRKRFEAREADLKDELAQANAAVAKMKANLTRAENNHRLEIEGLKESEGKMRLKLEEAESTSRSIQRTLAGIVTEKDKLSLENKELNAICEELMAELEGAKSQK